MGNTTKIEEKTETALGQVDEAPRETYHVLKFIQDHTSTFLAILSGTVAAAAFVLNLVAYVYQRIRLNPWNIAGDVIEFWGNRQFLLMFALELTYILLAYAIPVMLSRSFVYYHRLIATLGYWRAWIKSAKADQREIQKWIKDTRKAAKKGKAELGKKRSARLQEVEASVEEIKKELRTAKKDYWLTRGLAFLYIGFICLLTALMFIPVVILMTGIAGEIDWKVLLLFWGVSAALVVFFAKVKAKQMDKDCSLKAVRRDIKETVGEDDACQKLRDKMREMHKKSKERTATIRAFDDGTVREWGAKSLLAMVCMTLTLCVSAKDAAYKQKDFWIYTDAAQTYVVAYQDEGHCVLKQATLNGNEIIIHTGEQLVVSGAVATSQKTYDKVTFEE